MGEPSIEDLEAVQGSWVRTVKDLASGAAGGVAQVLLGESKSGSCVCCHRGVVFRSVEGGFSKGTWSWDDEGTRPRATALFVTTGF
jgi:hypothetical protein